MNHSDRMNQGTARIRAPDQSAGADQGDGTDQSEGDTAQ